MFKAMFEAYFGVQKGSRVQNKDFHNMKYGESNVSLWMAHHIYTEKGRGWV